MSDLLRRCFRKMASYNMYTKQVPQTMYGRFNSTFSNFQKTHLKYGAVISKPRSKPQDQGSSKKPLMVILGWSDCKPKHLEKYSNIFQSKGWSTICLPTKSVNTFFRSDTQVKKIGRFMAEVIKNETQNGQPVFLYSFSNGGCAVYFHLAEALTEEHHGSINVLGSIFDSCPVKPTIESVARVQRSTTERMSNPVQRFLLWHTIGLILPLLVKTSPTLQRFFNDLGKLQLRCPQLFLYSKADSLAPFEDIEEHMADRKTESVQIFSKCWEDSPHVMHYMKYPQEYMKVLEDFVTLCLNEQL